jgi:Plant transposon protein
MNDINVLVNTVKSIIAGDFPPKCNYRVYGNTYTMPYNQADGIYPTWAIFQKTIGQQCQESVAYLLHRQEAVRKDVERVFGVRM